MNELLKAIWMVENLQMMGLLLAIVVTLAGIYWMLLGMARKKRRAKEDAIREWSSAQDELFKIRARIALSEWEPQEWKL